MVRRNESTTFVGLVVTLALGLLSSGSAHAQANPELGETGGTAKAGGQVKGTWQPPTGTQNEGTATADTSTAPAATSTPSSGTTGPTPEGSNSGTDHSLMVHRWGVGFFGVMGVPTLGCAGVTGPSAVCAPTDFAATVRAPTIGVRYWLEEGLGIEAAIGLGIQSGGTTATTTGMASPPEVNAPSMFALVVHGGLPLVFAESKHFAFELVPEMNIGGASGSWTSQTNAKTSLSGFLFQLGARVGTEIQFGFMDIPQLALQASVGLLLSVQNRGGSQSNAPAAGTTDISNSQFNFGTTVNGAPWDIFTSNLTAIYYF